MKQKVILVHGYNKSCKDMVTLKENLEKLGYEGIVVDLPLTFKDIEYATLVFEEKVAEIICDLNEDEKISMIGHSTGGIVIRLLLSKIKYIDKIHRCVLIATPNKGSRLADITSVLSSVFINIFKTLKSIRTENIEKLNLKHIDRIEVGAIAGNKNNLFLGKLLNHENDGRVEVDSVEYAGLKDFIVVPYGHKEIHYKFEVAKLIDDFLKYGSFNKYYKG